MLRAHDTISPDAESWALFSLYFNIYVKNMIDKFLLRRYNSLVSKKQSSCVLLHVEEKYRKKGVRDGYAPVV